MEGITSDANFTLLQGHYHVLWAVLSRKHRNVTRKKARRHVTRRASQQVAGGPSGG